MDDLVSIIVPIYNVAPFIEKCARSLFTQTYQNIEYIFVDDCSPDDSIKILTNVIDEYGVIKSRVKIVAHDKNEGPGAARNTGLSMTSGSWCAFIDPDDWVEPGYVEHLVGGVKNGADYVFAGMTHDYSTNGDVVRVSYTSRQYDLDAIPAMDIAEILMHSCACGGLFQRKIIESSNLRFQPITLQEDTAFVMDYVCRAKRVAFMDTAEYHYVHHDMPSLTKRSRTADEYLRIAECLFSGWRIFWGRFKYVKPMELRHCIQRFGLSQLLQAVLAAYSRDALSYGACNNVIMAARRHRRDFALYYRPSSIAIKMLLLCILHLPIVPLHLLLKLGVAVFPVRKLV